MKIFFILFLLLSRTIFAHIFEYKDDTSQIIFSNRVPNNHSNAKIDALKKLPPLNTFDFTLSNNEKNASNISNQVISTNSITTPSSSKTKIAPNIFLITPEDSQTLWNQNDVMVKVKVI